MDIRAIFATLVAGVLATGCDPLPGVGGERGRSAANAPLPMPRAIAGSRAIAPERLIVRLDVSGEQVRVERRDGVWSARFLLARDDRNYSLSVRWSYDLDGDEIDLAETVEPVTINADSARSIEIGAYDTERFDFDGDGNDNLEEIDAGTDPLGGASTPGPGQGDCRVTNFSGIPDAEERAPRRLFRLREPYDESVPVALGEGRKTYFATFHVEVPGTLLIEHVGGQPVDTNAVLYDRTPAPAAEDQSSAFAVFANPSVRGGGGVSDGVRARIAQRLPVGSRTRGLYCYYLIDELAGNTVDAAPLTDLVLRVAFTPDTASAGR